MAFTWVVLVASQITKKSATASGILRRSSEIIFSPFFSWIACMIPLKIFEFRVSRPALFAYDAQLTLTFVPIIKTFFVIESVGGLIVIRSLPNFYNLKQHSYYSFGLFSQGSKIQICCHKLLPPPLLANLL